MTRLCPFCEKKYENLLAHFLVVHKIKNMNQLKEEIDKKEKADKKCDEFREYVERLHREIREGKMTTKDYRELIEKWDEEH